MGLIWSSGLSELQGEKLFSARMLAIYGGGGDRKDTERQVVHAVAAAPNPQTLWGPDGPKSGPGLTGESTGGDWCPPSMLPDATVRIPEQLASAQL